MAVPKKRTSRSRRNQRRAHDALKLTPATEACPSCGEMKLRHHVCAACGAYKGKQILPKPADAEATKPE